METKTEFTFDFSRPQWIYPKSRIRYDTFQTFYRQATNHPTIFNGLTQICSDFSVPLTFEPADERTQIPTERIAELDDQMPLELKEEWTKVMKEAKPYNCCCGLQKEGGVGPIRIPSSLENMMAIMGGSMGLPCL